MDYRFADNDPDRLAAYAEELSLASEAGVAGHDRSREGAGHAIDVGGKAEPIPDSMRLFTDRIMGQPRRCERLRTLSRALHAEKISTLNR
jgi:hypothetical protein